MYRIRMSGLDETCIVQKRWLWFFWYTPVEFAYLDEGRHVPIEYEFRDARNSIVKHIKREQYKYFKVE